MDLLIFEYIAFEDIQGWAVGGDCVWLRGTIYAVPRGFINAVSGIW